MTASRHDRSEINGAPATVEDLRHLVRTSYGHFSAMQVVDGGVRGLDLHLDRIEHATRELFGAAIDRERVRACLRHAVAGSNAPLSLRVNIFSRALNRERLAEPAVPDILVMTGPPSRPPSAPLRLKSFRYARDLPKIKHVGTFPLFHYRRLAQQAGFDDAVFADAAGFVSEGSIWNMGFSDGNGIVWPDAPQLTGISMQLLQAGLLRNGTRSEARPIALRDIGEFRAAFFTNSSTPVQPIAGIDDTRFVSDAALTALLAECYESNPLERI
ncbi:MAG TPA: aminotransferase class IV family protein [Rudaea sp.]|nr:aminotransferase class IV family protein [Rudaea sp.]